MSAGQARGPYWPHGGLVLHVRAPLYPVRDTRKKDADHLLLRTSTLARQLGAELVDLLADGLGLDGTLLALEGRLHLGVKAKLYRTSITRHRTYTTFANTHGLQSRHMNEHRIVRRCVGLGERLDVLA